MIKFVTEWFGLDQLSKEEFERLRPNTERTIMRVTLYFEGKVKKKLSARPARTGRIYIIKGRPHQASAPGEPPAPITGKLRQSITHTDVQWDGDQASAEVGSSDPKARILEFGGVTSKGIRILPRPFIGATWLEEEDRMQKMLDQAVSTKAPVLADLSAEETEP